MRILVTGGSGFIGSNFLNMMVLRHPEHRFLNIDCLTYASHPDNILPEVERAENYSFAKIDITNVSAIESAVAAFCPDWVVHAAAESHVDRSIATPGLFVQTNVCGTYNLLEACRNTWKRLDNKVFLHMSTDEVYGELEDQGYFTEDSPYRPSTPYAASKASADHIIKVYGRTYGLPINITNCTNNYGPNQHIEKLIPRIISLALQESLLTVHGNGRLIRDWLHVSDHCEAIWLVLEHGERGKSYNIGGNSERTNLEVITKICEIVNLEKRIPCDELIAFVPNRAGNDKRYAIDFKFINESLGWSPKVSFDIGLLETVKWYLQRQYRLGTGSSNET